MISAPIYHDKGWACVLFQTRFSHNTKKCAHFDYNICLWGLLSWNIRGIWCRGLGKAPPFGHQGSEELMTWYLFTLRFIRNCRFLLLTQHTYHLAQHSQNGDGLALGRWPHNAWLEATFIPICCYVFW